MTISLSVEIFLRDMAATANLVAGSVIMVFVVPYIYHAHVFTGQPLSWRVTSLMVLLSAVSFKLCAAWHWSYTGSRTVADAAGFLLAMASCMFALAHWIDLLIGKVLKDRREKARELKETEWTRKP